MTGHGRGTAEKDGRRATVEIRAVNHRFLDLKLRGSGVDAAVEDKIGAKVREKIERGAVTVTIHVDRHGGAALRLDHEAARAAHAALAGLAQALGLAPPDLSLVLTQPGVLVGAGDDDGGADEAVLEAATQALDRLSAMRAAEGATLGEDVRARLDTLTALLAGIEGAAASQPDEVRRRLTDRLSRLLEDAKVSVDPGRLAQEVALLADRADVTEELVRARSHIKEIHKLLAEPKLAVGRKLDFLIQELGREINTIGSKSSAAEISRLVVDGKAELEKIREQAQNLE
jgi:uncharacterized protein (TIGR00255 family)